MKKTLLITAAVAAMLSCAKNETATIEVVPYPNKVEMKAGTFYAAGASFHVDPAMDEMSRNAVQNFKTALSDISGQGSALSEGTEGQGFIFNVNPEIKPEGYKMKVSAKKAEVEASDLNGFIYAIQTLKQMLPAAIFGEDQAAKEDWTLPCCEIEDAPRFGYRGLHIDESRHFFGMDEIKKVIDLMTIHKMNTLHWHLTDDQGWRVEIKKYPRLAEVGSVRKETLVGHLFESDTYDGTPYGEGMWYTHEQIREVIGYAAARGIRIIPEIDLPGHMLAALTAYPELGCTGGPYDVWGKWGISDDVLCAGNEETMVFLENVLKEVADLFPGEYIHIGGDECPKTRWEKCPRCQAKIKELGLKDDERFKAEHYLQSYVMNRMTDFLSERGKKVIGWDEILEGEIADNAIVMSWRGTEGGLKAAQMGHDAIMTPNSYFYLDFYQTDDKASEPLAIGGYLPVEKCYSYEPYVEGMTEEEKSHILGVQANTWTEYIKTADHLEYMLLPRVAALSEVQWCNSENKCWERFLDCADNFCAIYDEAGYNYAKHIFNARGSVKIENGSVYVSIEAQGETPVRYTLDGSEPDQNSALYEGPVEIKGNCILSARSFVDGVGTRTYTKEFKAHKAMAADMTMNTSANPNYSAGLPDILADGIRGTDNFRSGEWGGWNTEPMDITVDMGEGKAYTKVTIGAVIVKYDDLFNPQSLKVLASEDGKEFVEIASKSFPAEGKDEPNGLKEYSVEFPETSAKYIRVMAEPVQALPEWHERKGNRGFIFVDEIVVE